MAGRGWEAVIPPPFVIPAKAGTQCGVSRRTLWVPAFAGMTKLGDAGVRNRSNPEGPLSIGVSTSPR